MTIAVFAVNHHLAVPAINAIQRSCLHQLINDPTQHSRPSFSCLINSAISRCCLQVCSWPLLRLLPALRAYPRLLVTPGERLYAAAATLQQQLRLSEEGLALALRRCVLCSMRWCVLCMLCVLRECHESFACVCALLGCWLQQRPPVSGCLRRCVGARPAQRVQHNRQVTMPSALRCCMKSAGVHCFSDAQTQVLACCGYVISPCTATFAVLLPTVLLPAACCCRLYGCCRAPAALLVPPGQLADLLAELAAALAVPTDVAADILLQVRLQAL